MAIIVDLNNLSDAIKMLQILRSGTGYKLHITSELINHSHGQMAQKTNKLYRELMNVEDVLLDIIEETISTLNNAGVSFAEMENELAEDMTTLGDVIIKGP